MVALANQPPIPIPFVDIESVATAVTGGYGLGKHEAASLLIGSASVCLFRTLPRQQEVVMIFIVVPGGLPLLGLLAILCLC